MAKLIILSGVPGSGKSYFSHLLRDHKHGHVYIISSDQLRDMVTGDQQDLSEDQLMWSFFYDLAKIYSRDKKGIVILDSTNTSAYYRVEAAKTLRPLFDSVDLISFKIKPETIYKQNLDREWPIPVEVLSEYIESFELPGEEDEKYFDTIHIISNKDFKEVVNKY
ncbi:MAG: ATP-binding protein [Bacilli bacterium]|nr:ATP-binding protein [Bacilli bacterium]